MLGRAGRDNAPYLLKDVDWSHSVKRVGVDWNSIKYVKKGTEDISENKKEP